MKNYSSTKLRKSLNLPLLIIYSVGTILGAGIFVVIGEVIGEAGKLTPLAYALAALVPITTALSFAELGARMPTAGGPIDYIEQGFQSRLAGSFNGWALLIANIVSATTIITGFINYLSVFFPVSDILVSSLIILFIASLSIVGMKQSSWFMAITTFIGIATLIAVLFATREGLQKSPEILGSSLKSVDWSLILAVLGGAYLAVYSFIGFGDVAVTAEEVQNVKRNLPLGISISVIIVTFFYFLISMALIGQGQLDEIAKAEAPLVHAVEMNGWPGWPVGIASLAVIINGALTQIIAASRLLYDLGRDKRGAPEFLGHINMRTRTPIYATVFVSVSVLILTIFVPLKGLAVITSSAILVVFILSNMALVRLKRKSQPEDVPNIPVWLPWIGALICSLALCYQITDIITSLFFS